jgi:hypothetical protein
MSMKHEALFALAMVNSIGGRMRIGIPKEPYEAQTLVSASPDTVGKLMKLGYDVCVESGAGVAASYFDDAYEAVSASIVSKEEAWGSDIVTCLDTPTDAELSLVKKGAVLIARKFGWERVFDGIYAGDMFKDDPAVGKMTKSALLAFLVRKYAAAPGDCTIVGDTKSDFVAAKDNGIESVGVTWGYGKPEELALASRIAATPAEV